MRAHLAKMSLLFAEADTSGDGRLDMEDQSDAQTYFSKNNLYILYVSVHFVYMSTHYMHSKQLLHA